LIIDRAMEKISEVLILSTGQTVKLEGEKGTTFTPSVDANGNLSWTNDGGKQNPTTVNIKGERGEKGDTTVIDPSTATAYTLYNQTGKHTDGAMTQAAVTEEFEKLDEVYTRNDGYYESMGVGMATNLKGQNVVDAEFTYRKSGGNVEVQDGNAMIEAIKGNTIAWNQNQKYYANFTEGMVDSSGCSVTYSNGVLIASGGTSTGQSFKLNGLSGLPFVVGHKYYCVVNATTTAGVSVYLSEGSGFFGELGISNEFVRNRYIATNNYSAGTTGFGFYISSHSSNWEVKIKYVSCIDLTLIYGSGNEPTTVEQFEQDYFNWFGKPLTYEPYDAGSLRNTKVSALKTTGFNQWDEEWEVGSLNSNGVPIVGTAQIRSKNYIPSLENETYKFYCTSASASQFVIYFYDANKNIIPYTGKGAYQNGYNGSSGLFTTPSGTSFMRFRGTDNYGNTYNHDICINISDPNRNGEYEPYKESTLPLDVTTLKGKLNGEGSSVVVFADGMNSAGNVHDEIKIENGVVKAIKRVGKVDLGSLNWGISNTTMYANVNGGKVTSYPLELNNVDAKYITTTNSWQALANKTQSFGEEITTMGVPCIVIRDDDYSDATTFKAAMNGVMLYYELKEPEVYVLDDFNLPKLYPVANGGTEEQLSNSPNSLPATLSIRYGLNAAAFIQNAPKNYISKESMSNFLSNLGSAMGGTWTMTWNSSTNKYDFSFTKNRSVDVEQPIEDK
jgi:hypothetical protein